MAEVIIYKANRRLRELKNERRSLEKQLPSDLVRQIKGLQRLLAAPQKKFLLSSHSLCACNY